MKDRIGRTLFAPFGIFGKCYVVANAEMEKRIRRFNRWFVPILLYLFVTVLVFWGSGVALIVLVTGMVLMWVRYRIWQSKMTVCEPHNIPSLREINSALMARPWKLKTLAMFAFGTASLIAAVYLILRGGYLASVAGGVVGLACYCGVATQLYFASKLR